MPNDIIYQNISNSHNSFISQARSAEFCMIIFLHNTNSAYYAILYHKIPIIPNIFNSHNSLIFQARSPTFFIVIFLHNTNSAYYAILYHTIKYQIIPNIFNCHITQSFFKLGVRNFAW